MAETTTPAPDGTGVITRTGTGVAEGTASAQRRTLRVLFATQVLGGIGMAIGYSVAALLTADMVAVGMSGLAQSAAVVGAACSRCRRRGWSSGTGADPA